MIKLYEPKIYQEDIDLINKTLSENWISGNSPIVKDFEDKLKEFCGVKYCLSASSGTTALHLALLGSNIQKGDEVIVPSLSYIASANAVSYVQAKPIFVDVDRNTFQLDVSEIESKITDKTSAILPVHLYGVVPDLKEINNIANKYGLKIIHDAAEALGSIYENRHSVSFKDVGIVSFFPNKVITTGEGGALLTNDEEIYLKALKFRSQGLVENTDYVHDEIGYNYRISALSAALGYNQVDKIFKHIELKSKVFKKYKTELEKHGVRFQTIPNNVKSSYWLTVGIFENNINVAGLKDYLKDCNIETRRVFLPLHKQKPYLTPLTDNFPNSEYLYNQCLCLPSYPYIKDEILDYVIKKIISYLNST